MKKPLTVLLAAFATFVIGIVLLPRIMPDDYTRRQLGRALERETGIQLERAENIRLTLFPRLGIVLEKATLRSPGLAQMPALTAERVTADVDPWALLERRLKLERLVVESPAMTFHVDASGQRNWDFGAAAPVAAPPRMAALGNAVPQPEVSPPQIPTLRSRKPRLPTATIEIRDGTFTYLDEIHSRRVEIGNLDLLLRSSRSDSEASVEGGFRLRGEDVRLKAELRDQISLSEPSSPLRVEVSARAGAAVFDGVTAWKDERNLRGQLRFELASGAALQDWLGESMRALAAVEKATLGGTLLIDEQHASFNEGRLQAGEAVGELDLAMDFDGRGSFNLHRLDLHGGSASGRLTVDARQRAAIVAGSFEMDGVDSLALFKGLSGFDWISGRAGAKLHVAGGGDSVSAVLNTLTGEGSLSVRDGAVEGLDIPALIAKAREGEFKSWKRRHGQRTRFDSLTSTFVLDKGIARSRELALAGPEIAATGEGETNIPAQSLDYRLKVKVEAATEEERAKAEEGRVEIPLIIRGDWEKPDIYPDLDKVLRDPKALGDTAKAIGKSLEKLTEGKIKSEDVGKAIEQLFGGGKKKREE